MKIRRGINAGVFVLMLFLAGCNLPRPDATAEATSDPIGTAAAQTVAALSTQLMPRVTITPPDLATQDILTATATLQPTAGPTTESTPAKPCDRGEFVADVTVNDGDDFKPGETFTKTWRLKNTGSCTWTTSYRVIFDSGNALGAPASFNLPVSVSPDGIVDISVQMKAPDVVKAYDSYWKLQNASGVPFGLGENAQKSFWVKIEVVDSVKTFAVNNVEISTANTNVAATCPYNFPLTAKITTTAAGKVSFYWERSDTVKSGTQEVTFDAAGTRSIDFAWPFPASFDGTVRIYVDSPNHQYFSPFSIKLTCN